MTSAKKILNRAAVVLIITATFLPPVLLLLIVLVNAIPALSLQFFFSSSDNLASGGILSPILGTLTLSFLSLFISVPIGLAAAIFLSEYMRPGFFRRAMEVTLFHLSNLPSIVYGLFGFAVFVLLMRTGVSLLAGALTLTCLGIPLISTFAYQALRSVPAGIRETAASLGADRWQMISGALLPSAMPGILTGILLTAARIVGETAPVMFTAAVYFFPGLPQSLMDPGMVLSFHLYSVSTQVSQVPAPQKFAIALTLVILAVLVNLATFLVRGRLDSRGGYFK